MILINLETLHRGISHEMHNMHVRIDHISAIQVLYPSIFIWLYGAKIEIKFAAPLNIQTLEKVNEKLINLINHEHYGKALIYRMDD